MIPRKGKIFVLKPSSGLIRLTGSARIRPAAMVRLTDS
jgi:hypothetical protein